VPLRLILKEGVGTKGFPEGAKELPVVLLGATTKVGNSYTEGIHYIVLTLMTN
jgi:hypothetical protein